MDIIQAYVEDSYGLAIVIFFHQAEILQPRDGVIDLHNSLGIFKQRTLNLAPAALVFDAKLHRIAFPGRNVNIGIVVPYGWAVTENAAD